MHFSRTELQTIAELAKGNTSISTVAEALNKSEKHIYRIVQKLEEKDLAALSSGEIIPKKSTLMVRLTRILDSYPNLIPVLADSGIPILVSLLEAKSVDEITEETDVKKSTVYALLKKALKISLVKKDGERYVLNEKIWGEVPDLLREIRDIERLLDPRVPYNSVIYYRNRVRSFIPISMAGIPEKRRGFRSSKRKGSNSFCQLPITIIRIKNRKKSSQKKIFSGMRFMLQKKKLLSDISYSLHFSTVSLRTN